MMFNNSVWNELAKVVSTTEYNKLPGLGAKYVRDWYFTDAAGNVRKAQVTFTFGRFMATVAAAGVPIAVTYDATYGPHVYTGTYAAKHVTNFGGISITANSFVAGNNGWIQTGGPNIVGVLNTGAIADGARVEHNGSGSSVKTIATAINGFGKYTGPAIAGDGTIPAGCLILEQGRFG